MTMSNTSEMFINSTHNSQDMTEFIQYLVQTIRMFHKYGIDDFTNKNSNVYKLFVLLFKIYADLCCRCARCPRSPSPNPRPHLESDKIARQLYQKNLLESNPRTKSNPQTKSNFMQGVKMVPIVHIVSTESGIESELTDASDAPPTDPNDSTTDIDRKINDLKKMLNKTPFHG